MRVKGFRTTPQPGHGTTLPPIHTGLVCFILLQHLSEQLKRKLYNQLL